MISNSNFELDPPTQIDLRIEMKPATALVAAAIFVSLSFQSDAGHASHVAGQPPSHGHEWNEYRTNLCALHLHQQSACSLMPKPLMEHVFSLTPTQLRRGMAYVGPNHRMRRMVRDMVTGTGPELNIGVIGTSVSWGTGEADCDGTLCMPLRKPLSLHR